MIRYYNLYLPSRLFIIAALDFAFAACALGVAMRAGPATVPLHPLPVLAILLWGATACIVFFYFFDLYDFDRERTAPDYFAHSLGAIGFGLLIVLPIRSIVFPNVHDLGLVEISLLGLAIVLSSSRTLVQWLQTRILPRQRVVLVGSSPAIYLLAHEIESRKSLPLKLRGVVANSTSGLPLRMQLSVCGNVSELLSVVSSFGADRVAICPDAVKQIPLEQLVNLRGRGVRVDDAISLYESVAGRVPVTLIDTRQLSYGRGFAHSSVVFAMYRAAGAVMAFLMLVTLLPVFVLLGLLIKLDSRGPIFYLQERVGLNGNIFKVVKFRSMRTDAEKDSGPVWAATRDRRVTRMGRVLRTLRLDELPQLWNVLVGDMAFFGPRPERPHFVSMLTEKIPYYGLRHSIRPGITGWAQVCAGYGATVEESREKLEYDLFYLKNCSLFLDALIFVKTIKIMLRGKGAR